MHDLQWTVKTPWRDTQKLTLVQIQRCIFRAGWGSGDVGGRGAGWGGEGQRCGDGVTLRSAAAALWRDGSPVSVWNLEKLTRQETHVFNVSHPLYDEDNPQILSHVYCCVEVTFTLCWGCGGWQMNTPSSSWLRPSTLQRSRGTSVDRGARGMGIGCVWRHENKLNGI